jgi:DNA-binding transcriptional LysR family regulator
MELRHLRYFVAVAEELHFRRAAERLHIAQPAVSEQIRKLEAELGVLLLNRTQRSVTLTPAGAVLLEEARRVIRQSEIAREAARSARRNQLGRLHVGYTPDAVPRYVPRSLTRFAEAAPGIEVVLETGSALALAADVRGGRLDLAVVCLPLATGGLRVTRLGEERAVCAVPATRALANQPAISPAQLADHRLNMLPRANNPAFYDGVIGAWRDAGLTAEPRESEPRVDHLLLAVAAGAGVAMLPSSIAERYEVAGVRFVPLEPPVACDVALLSRDEDSTTITAFLRLARASAAATRAPAITRDAVLAGAT